MSLIPIFPVIAFQDTEKNTTSATLVTADCTTAPLVNLVEYVVFFTGNFGGSTTSNTGSLVLSFGTTEIAISQGEGLGRSHHSSTDQTMGHRFITGNGTDTLNFKFQANSGTIFCGAMAIMAIPLTDLVEGRDYWRSGTNSATYEVNNASTSWETLRLITTTAFDVPRDGDYLVFPSCEGRPAEASGGAEDRTRVRMSVDGTFILEASSTSGQGYVAEWEDNLDIGCIAGVRVMNLTAGQHTMLIECASVSGFTARSDYRRSNIFVLNMSTFDQFVQTQDTTGVTGTSATYADFTGLNQTYTPNQEEHVLHFAYGVPANASNIPCLLEIRNTTDSTSHCIDSGEYNNDNGFDANRDMIPVIAMYSDQYSTAKAWRTRFRTEAGTSLSTVGKNRDNTAGIESNFISLGLTIAVPTAALTGTITAATTEADIVAGGKTILLTLTDTEWVAAGATFDAQRQAIIDGLDSVQIELLGWNNEVRDKQPVTAVVRTSATLVTITLVASALYDITAEETITSTIPFLATTSSNVDIIAVPTFNIAVVGTPTTAALGGTAPGSAESEIVDGGQTITLTLTNDTWVAPGPSFDGQRQAIIDGLTSAQSELTGWNNEVRDKEVVTSVIRSDALTVTITLSASADYNILSPETITSTIPAAALNTSLIDVVAVPAFIINIVSSRRTGIVAGRIIAAI